MLEYSDTSNEQAFLFITRPSKYQKSNLTIVACAKIYQCQRFGISEVRWRLTNLLLSEMLKQSRRYEPRAEREFLKWNMKTFFLDIACAILNWQEQFFKNCVGRRIKCAPVSFVKQDLGWRSVLHLVVRLKMNQRRNELCCDVISITVDSGSVGWQRYILVIHQHYTKQNTQC